MTLNTCRFTVSCQRSLPSPVSIIQQPARFVKYSCAAAGFPALYGAFGGFITGALPPHPHPRDTIPWESHFKICQHLHGAGRFCSERSGGMISLRQGLGRSPIINPSEIPYKGGACCGTGVSQNRKGPRTSDRAQCTGSVRAWRSAGTVRFPVS